MKHSHYFKPVPAGATHIDVYRVLEMFGVTDPCLQHAAKKTLMAGGRGHKDQRKDIQEAIDTLQRRLAMWDEDAAPAAGAPYIGPDRRGPDRKPTCECTITCEHTPGKVCRSKRAAGLVDGGETYVLGLTAGTAVPSSDPVVKPTRHGDGWIPWAGGECPVEKGTLVDVKFRDGHEMLSVPAQTKIMGSDYEANGAFWERDGMCSDIIAYRLTSNGS